MDKPEPENRTSYPIPGPGILIALSSSGWVGLLSLISFGGDRGYAFLGITVITLFFKYSIITGMARFTLASGTDIFAGLATVPGPKNWAVWMIHVILYIEIFMLGFSSYTVVRLFNELFGFTFPPICIIILLFTLLFILVALNSYWLFRTLLIRAVIFFMVAFGLLVLQISVPVQEIAAGFIPAISSYISVYETSVIICSVGSGFSLLFYSVWLVSHLRGRVQEDEDAPIYRRIQIDAGLGMFLLFLLCVLYYSIGYIFLYEHGLGAPESDLTLEIVLTIMNLGLYGSAIFAFVCILALFCSLLGGLYGRARVLQVTLPRTIPGLQISRTGYLFIVLCLVLSAVCSDLFFTQIMVKEFIAIRLILFSLVASLLILINSRLKPEYRGSPAWYIVMGTGTILSLIIGINLLDRYFHDTLYLISSFL